MANAKQVTGILVYANTETAYNEGATIAATDVISVAQEHPVFNIGYAVDGARAGEGGAAWSGGRLRGSAPVGRILNPSTIRIEQQGRGESPSGSSSTPPNGLHRLLEACGMTGSYSASYGYTYVPVAVQQAPRSAGLRVYTRGEAWSVSGSLGTFNIQGGEGSTVVYEFEVQGTISSLPVDSPTVPAYTFGHTHIIPPANQNINLSIGGVTGLVVRDWNYSHNLTISPRLDRNFISGHHGFVLGRRSPSLTITIENPAQATFNAYNIHSSASVQAVSFTVGTAGNGTRYEFPYCTLSNVENANDGDVATQVLTFTPSVSGPGANDDVRITFI